MSTTEMADTFRRAAEVIRIGGLARGEFEYGTMHCTVGALMVAKGMGAVFDMWDLSTVQSEINHLAGLLGTVDELPVRAVTNWNDSYNRTARDVITLLEQAAEKVEADL